MEYVDGEDLRSLLRRIGRLPSAKALDVTRQICAGFGAAHDRGVLHRDLKPANVMIDGRGIARIIDLRYVVSSADDLLARRSAAPPPAPWRLAGDMDAQVEHAIMRVLATDPADRPESVAQFVGALPIGDLLADMLRAGGTPPPAMVAGSGSAAGLEPRVAWALLVLLIAAAVAAAALGARGLIWRQAAPGRSSARDSILRTGWKPRPCTCLRKF